LFRTDRGNIEKHTYKAGRECQLYTVLGDHKTLKPIYKPQNEHVKMYNTQASETV